LISRCSWLWLVVSYGCCSVGILVMVRCCLMLSLLDIGFVWISLGLRFVQLIVVEYLFWTIEQFVGVYILYGCVNLFTSLCISIFPCGCEWWLLSSLLLMVLCVFPRYGLSLSASALELILWGRLDLVLWCLDVGLWACVPLEILYTLD